MQGSFWSAVARRAAVMNGNVGHLSHVEMLEQRICESGILMAAGSAKHEGSGSPVPPTSVLPNVFLNHCESDR